MDLENRAHFFAVCTRLMRQILVSTHVIEMRRSGVEGVSSR